MFNSIVETSNSVNYENPIYNDKNGFCVREAAILSDLSFSYRELEGKNLDFTIYQLVRTAIIEGAEVARSFKDVKLLLEDFYTKNIKNA